MKIQTTANTIITGSGVNSGDVLFSPAAVTVTHSASEAVGSRIVIAASGSHTLNFGSIAAVAGLYVRGNRDFELTLNGAASPLEIAASTPGTGMTARVYLDATITAVVIDNPSADDELAVEVAVWGD